jgi:uncharacterized protein
MHVRPTPETATFWAHAAEGVLALPFCAACERFFFYPRPFCPRCWSYAVEWKHVSGRGRVVSYTIVERLAAGLDRAIPYVVAIVELEEGERLMANVVGVAAEPDAIPLDLEVEVAFEHADGVDRPVFRPREPR